jgi:tellurite resistance protein
MKIPIIPASYFGMVLGLSGLGASWRFAAQVWGLPPVVGETISLFSVAVWAILLILFSLKWLVARPDAVAEVAHPVACCFIGLAGVATMLAAGGLLPYSRMAAEILVAAGGLFTLGFGIWRTGGLWQGGRDPAFTTPILYLPTVAGSFVTAILLSALGHADWGRLFFGAALFSWLAIESVLIHRFYSAPAMAEAMRPTFGVQIAPAPVGLLAYLSVNPGPADLFAYMLLGYGLLQTLIMLRLLPWIRKEPFAASYWAFTFGITALATGPLRLVARGDIGPAAELAPYLFVFANLVVGLVALGTLHLLARGRLNLKWTH